MSEDFQTKYDAFRVKVIDLFYEEYFKGIAGHADWTDEEIGQSANWMDVESCLNVIKDVLYKEFDNPQEKHEEIMSDDIAKQKATSQDS